MKLTDLLEYLEEIADNSSKVPLTNKVMINKKELKDTIKKVIDELPKELKEAQWVLEEKERILSDAKKEAEELKRQGLEQIRRKIQNHDITKEAGIRAEEIVSAAQRDAKVIRIGSREYADSLLTSIDNEINKRTAELAKQMKLDMQGFLNNVQRDANVKSSEIRSNIRELRNMK